MDSDKNNETLT